MQPALPAILRVAALLEAGTGVAFAIAPGFFASLLFGGELAGSGAPLARVAGVALLSLGVACWPRQNAGDSGMAWVAMLIYNALATVYFGYLGIAGQWVGPLLWPAALLHAVMTVLLFRYRTDR